MEKEDEGTLQRIERNILRGISTNDGNWRVKTVKEFEDLYQPNIIFKVKRRRIRWLGHGHRPEVQEL